MKSKIGVLIILVAALNLMAFSAVPADVKPAAQEDTAVAEEEISVGDVKLPSKDTPEYWNVRSEAVSQLLPLLTKKRAEMKKIQQTMADYMVKLNVASDFAGKNIAVPTDPNVFWEIFQFSQALKPTTNVPKLQKRPTWDELMELAMKHIVSEGYLPTLVEGGEDMSQYIKTCETREQYGQKVRNELRGIMDKCAKMWVFLDSIGQKNEFKVYCAELVLEQKSMKAQDQATAAQLNREQRLAQSNAAKQQKLDDAAARAQFESSKKQRLYDDRQARLQHSQTLLDQRFVNSGYNY